MKTEAFGSDFEEADRESKLILKEKQGDAAQSHIICFRKDTSDQTAYITIHIRNKTRE